MKEVTQILNAIEQGDAAAADDLLPLVYDELRRLAAHHLAKERPGQTLQATALVHEAYLRLVGSADPGWENRRHFFGAAAEAMRRILVESARKKRAVRHGGALRRVDLDSQAGVVDGTPGEMIALSEALDALEAVDARASGLVKLRYFAGLTNAQAADALNVSVRTADRIWAFAKAWLFDRLSERRQEEP